MENEGVKPPVFMKSAFLIKRLDEDKKSFGPLPSPGRNSENSSQCSTREAVDSGFAFCMLPPATWNSPDLSSLATSFSNQLSEGMTSASRKAIYSPAAFSVPRFLAAPAPRQDDVGRSPSSNEGRATQ